MDRHGWGARAGTGAVLLIGLAAGCAASNDPVPTEGPTGGDGTASTSQAGTDGGTDSDTTAPAGPVELSAPLELAIVEQTSPTPCDEEALPGPEDSECLTLGDSMTLTEVEELTMATPTSGLSSESDEDVLQLTMNSQDGADFYDLTSRAAELPHPRIAMVVDGEVISAPILAQAIPGGAVEISGWDDAEEFVAESTGSTG